MKIKCTEEDPIKKCNKSNKNSKLLNTTCVSESSSQDMSGGQRDFKIKL